MIADSPAVMVYSIYDTLDGRKEKNCSLIQINIGLLPFNFLSHTLKQQ
jgi:hypothetical protein